MEGAGVARQAARNLTAGTQNRPRGTMLDSATSPLRDLPPLPQPPSAPYAQLPYAAYNAMNGHKEKTDTTDAPTYLRERTTRAPT